MIFVVSLQNKKKYSVEEVLAEEMLHTHHSVSFPRTSLAVGKNLVSKSKF